MKKRYDFDTLMILFSLILLLSWGSTSLVYGGWFQGWWAKDKTTETIYPEKGEDVDLNGQSILNVGNIQNLEVVHITTYELKNFIANYDANTTVPISVTYGNILYVSKNSVAQGGWKMTLPAKAIIDDDPLTYTNKGAVFEVIAENNAGFSLDCPSPNYFILNGTALAAGDQINCTDAAFSELSCLVGKGESYICKTQSGTCVDGN